MKQTFQISLNLVLLTFFRKGKILGLVRLKCCNLLEKFDIKRETWSTDPKFGLRKQDVWDIKVRDNKIILLQILNGQWNLFETLTNLKCRESNVIFTENI